MSSRVPSRDFLARKARAQRRRCGKTPAGRASSSPGGIGTWEEEAPPPPNDLASYFRKLSPFAPLLSAILGVGGSRFRRPMQKEDQVCPFQKEGV